MAVAEAFLSIMLEQELVISNKLGLHARASAKLVQLLQPFKSTVWISFRDREVNAKSIMGVMMLAAGIGSAIKLRVEGPDEAATLSALIELFERKFDEGG